MSSGELIRRVNSSPANRLFEPEVVKEARKAYNDVQLAEFRVAGHVALAGKTMEHAKELHQIRQQEAKGDPALEAILGDIEDIAFNKLKSINRGLFDGFGL